MLDFTVSSDCDAQGRAANSVEDSRTILCTTPPPIFQGEEPRLMPDFTVLSDCDAQGRAISSMEDCEFDYPPPYFVIHGAETIA